MITMFWDVTALFLLFSLDQYFTQTSDRIQQSKERHLQDRISILSTASRMIRGPDEPAMIRGPDPWANIDTGHLNPSEKKRALKLKEKLIETQSGKTFLHPPGQPRQKLDGKTIENCEDLDNIL